MKARYWPQTTFEPVIVMSGGERTRPRSRRRSVDDPNWTSARLGLVHARHAGDLLHRAHPVVGVAIFGLDHDVIGAGVAIGAKPCAQLGRVLAIEARAQRDGKGLVRPQR